MHLMHVFFFLYLCRKRENKKGGGGFDWWAIFSPYLREKRTQNSKQFSRWTRIKCQKLAPWIQISVYTHGFTFKRLLKLSYVYKMNIFSYSFCRIYVVLMWLWPTLLTTFRNIILIDSPLKVNIKLTTQLQSRKKSRASWITKKGGSRLYSWKRRVTSSPLSKAKCCQSN